MEPLRSPDTMQDVGLATRSADPASPDAGWHPRRLVMRHRVAWRIVLTILATLLILRALAPAVVTWSINRTLARQGDVQGSIHGVSLGILAGSYDILGLHLFRVDTPSGQRLPIFDLQRLGGRISWLALLHGRLEGSVMIDHPVYHWTLPQPPVPHPPARPPSPPPTGSKTAKPTLTGNWRAIVSKLVPFRISRIELKDGLVVWDDPHRHRHGELSAISGSVRDLIVPAGRVVPATFHFVGSSIGHGSLLVEGHFLAHRDSPELGVQARLEHLDLTALNPFTADYDGLTFASGSFSAYVEANVAKGRINGSIKPLFIHLHVAAYHKKKGSAALKLFWKVAVPIAQEVLRNGPKDQHAAHIPIHGSIDDPHTDPWAIAGSILRNAFIRAFIPGFDMKH